MRWVPLLSGSLQAAAGGGGEVAAAAAFISMQASFSITALTSQRSPAAAALALTLCFLCHTVVSAGCLQSR